MTKQGLSLGAVLGQVLERQPRGLGAVETRRVMWQLVKAVDYLHSRTVGPLFLLGGRYRQSSPKNIQG